MFTTCHKVLTQGMWLLTFLTFWFIVSSGKVSWEHMVSALLEYHFSQVQTVWSARDKPFFLIGRESDIVFAGWLEIIWNNKLLSIIFLKGETMSCLSNKILVMKQEHGDQILGELNPIWWVFNIMWDCVLIPNRPLLQYLYSQMATSSFCEIIFRYMALKKINYVLEDFPVLLKWYHLCLLT